jgi:di/tricarboxylate transporter
MEPSALLLLLILAATVASFVLEWLPLDVTALAALGALLLFDLVTAEEAVEGFSNPAVVTVMLMFVLGEGLSASGILPRMGVRLARMAGASTARASASLLALSAGLSAFLNNTAVVSIFMPIALDLARRFKTSPSKLLLPLSYASILGGMCTLIGTSTNLLASALAVENGLPPFRVFEFLWLGAPLLAIGLLYLLLAGPRLLPDRLADSSLTGKYRINEFLTEVKVPESSPLLGRTVLAEHLSDRFDLNVIEILRGKRRIATDLRYTPLETDDVLIVRGSMEEILALKEHYGLLLLSDIKLQDQDLADQNNVLVEVQLAPNSRLAGATLKEIDFRKSYGCFVLALNRGGGVIRDKLALVPLRPLDTLLVFGPRQRIEGLNRQEDFLPLQELTVRLRVSRRWWIGALAIPAVVALAALGVMSILKAALLAVVALLLTGAVRIQRAYAAIDWTVIFMLAAILPLGTAMTKTGLAATLGHGLVAVGGTLGPLAVLGLLTLCTSLLTGFISNNSAAVLMVPIAVSAGRELGVDPKPLLMGVTFAASLCFFTPMGYQTNAMVYSPGGYRFGDFLRAGGPLNFITWLTVTLLIPSIWRF